MPYRKRDRRSERRSVDDERRRDSDRRLSTRILIDLEVDYQCEDTFLFAYITDMSALGIFIRTNNPEPPGTHLNLRFTLPGDETPLQLEAEVIWINPFRPGNFDNINPGMGVRFVDQAPALTRRLMELVRKIAYLEDDEPDEDEVQQQDDEREEERPLTPATSEEVPVYLEETGEKKRS